MIIRRLQEVIEQNRGAQKGLLRNLLKEELQFLVLEFIYNSKWANLIFEGGSCLRICFGLNRLSEDLDFDYQDEFDSKSFSEAVINYFKKDLGFSALEAKSGRERLYLKFPVLRSLGVSRQNESDKLYVKIELSRVKKCNFKTELQPIFKKGTSFVARRYDLGTLMAGKINALLGRVWFRGKRDEITVKGRDYYDLIWYMEKKVEPNYGCIKYRGRKLTKKEVWEKVKNRVEKVNLRHLEYDLLNLVENPSFVKKFSKNYKILFANLLNYYLKND